MVSKCSSPNSQKGPKRIPEFLSHVEKYFAVMIAVHLPSCTDYSERHQNVKEALLLSAFPTTPMIFLYFSQGLDFKEIINFSVLFGADAVKG